jgi:site-specific recombinase XerC
MICVHGKGNKVRVLPLASETVRLLDHYLRLERPAAGGSALFVSLKGGGLAGRASHRRDRALYSVITASSAVSPAPTRTASGTLSPRIWFAPESSVSNEKKKTVD